MRPADTPPEAGTDGARAMPMVKCPRCNGNGGWRTTYYACDPSGDEVTCQACEGTGEVPADEAADIDPRDNPDDDVPLYDDEPPTLEHGR